MQDLKVFMQPWSTLHAWHDHLCSMRCLPNHLIASSSSPSPSHFIATSYFHKFSSLTRSDHVEKNSFHAWCIKLYFHQVFIHPQQTPIEWVMPILLRCCNLSKADFRLHIAQCFCHISLYGSSNSSILDVLEPALDGDSDFQLFIPWTCLTRSSKLMKTATSVFEVRWRWCTGLQFLWVWLLSS
jgi:hypothetical protein